MPSAITTNLFGSGQTVRAWCHTGFSSNTSTLAMTAQNFINGYNLTFDDAAYHTQLTTTGTAQRGICLGAIPFKFVTPLENNRYKIFVQPVCVTDDGTYGLSSTGTKDPITFYAHSLNGTQYPKTRNGFWIRFGIKLRHRVDSFYYSTLVDGTTTVSTPQPGIGEVLNRTVASNNFQLQVLVL